MLARGPLSNVPTILSSIVHRSVSAAAASSTFVAVPSPPPPMLLIRLRCGGACCCTLAPGGACSCSRKSGMSCSGRSAMRSASAPLAARPSGSLRTAISNSIGAVVDNCPASAPAAAVACEAASTSLKKAVANLGNPAPLPTLSPAVIASSLPPLLSLLLPAAKSAAPLTNASCCCRACSFEISCSTSRASNAASSKTEKASVGLNLPSASAIVATAAAAAEDAGMCAVAGAWDASALLLATRELSRCMRAMICAAAFAVGGLLLSSGPAQSMHLPIAPPRSITACAAVVVTAGPAAVGSVRCKQSNASEYNGDLSLYHLAVAPSIERSAAPTLA